MTAAEVLADWSATLELADVPNAARHAAVRQLLDGLGTALAARRSQAIEPAVLVAQQLGGPAEARVIGSRQRLSAPAAAFANGALVHALDFDDTHAGGLIHATAVVLPAAFAVGEQVGATGAQVLTAALAGYEVACRIAMACPHGFHARGLHATQIAGVFAAATVTARLLNLSPATTTAALGVAGSSAGGLLEFLSTGSSTKQLHPGSASLNGILAARLAAAGATGPASVLEGKHGIYATLADRPADPRVVTSGLGETWQVTRITVKPYPACQLMHAALDATSVALNGERLAAADVVRIDVDVHPDSAAVVCEPAQDKQSPRSPYDAKFSLPWSVAALIVDGEITVDTYRTQSIARPELRELTSRVHTRLVASPGLAAEAPGRIEIVLRDGSVLTGDVACSSGGPDAPVSDDQLYAKLLANTGEATATGELRDRLFALDAESDLSTITGLLSRILEE